MVEEARCYAVGARATWDWRELEFTWRPRWGRWHEMANGKGAERGYGYSPGQTIKGSKGEDDWEERRELQVEVKSVLGGECRRVVGVQQAE